MIKNCYFPNDYDFLETKYGYDIYSLKIKNILEENEYEPLDLYIHMVIKYPNSNEKEEVVERMIWNDKSCDYDWNMDWCEGQTEVCLMAIYTDDFIENLCKRYSHKNRCAGGWFNL